MAVYQDLLKKAQYAIASLSRDLVYETYGMAKMAYQLDAINKGEFYELNRILVRDGLNNYANCPLK